MRLRLAVLFVLCAGCDESAPESTSPPATNEATTNEATAQAAAPAANSCAMTIRVSGDHTFEDEVSFRVARVERNDGAWLSLMATEVTNQPGYILNMFLRADASGGVPLDEPGMNKLNITMVPGEDYSAHDMGGEAAGSVTVTQGPEGWLSAEGTGHLSDGNGGELHVIVHVTTAIPPMQCPRD
ncbi:MAG: hypothetical protein AB8H86_30900 [Polyangiales bacterium]